MLHLPAAPAAVLAASERPSLPLVGAAAAAACIAAHRPSSPLVGVLASGSAPGSASSLSRWQLAGEPERRRWRDGSGRRGRRLPRCRVLFLGRGRGRHNRDSSLALLLTGSPSSPPLARSAISFLAATLLALEVRCTPSPAQMLVPSTVVRSCGGDSLESKKLRRFMILANPVLSPIEAASSRHGAGELGGEFAGQAV
jgi:hypothetical protein